MAAPIARRQCRDLVSFLAGSPRHSSNAAGSAVNPPKGGVLQYLCDRFYDIEAFVEFGIKLKTWNLERKNRYNFRVCQQYGDDIAAAVFAMTLSGGVRFQGQAEWYREKSRRKYSQALAQFLKVPLEAVDVSRSVISYDGMDNLVNLKALKHLDLSGCPYIDDWSLSRLHVFRDTLQELSLAGCPQVSEKGLACLHHLENLKRLDVSNLPSVSCKGLIRILLEEMLPQCEIVGMDCSISDLQQTEREHQGAASDRKANDIPI